MADLTTSLSKSLASSKFGKQTKKDQEMLRIFTLVAALTVLSISAHANLNNGNPLLQVNPGMDIFERFENATTNRVDMFLYVTKLEGSGDYVATFMVSSPFVLYMDEHSPVIQRSTYNLDLVNLMDRIASRKKNFPSTPGKWAEDELALRDLLNHIISGGKE